MNGSQIFNMEFGDYFKLCEIHINYTCKAPYIMNLPK